MEDNIEDRAHRIKCRIESLYWQILTGLVISPSEAQERAELCRPKLDAQLSGANPPTRKPPLPRFGKRKKARRKNVGGSQ